MKWLKTLLITIILVGVLDYAAGFECYGSGMNWQSSSGVLATCGEVESCVPFNTPQLTISGSEITMQRCYTMTYPYRTLLNKLMRDDLLVYNTFRTVPGAVYNLSFEWDGLVISNDCDTTQTNVLMAIVYNGHYSLMGLEITNRTYYCEGTVCSGNYTGYKYDSFSFTAQSNQSTIIFRTITNKAVRVKLRNVRLNSTSIPCQDVCGGDSRCNGHMPNSTTNKCDLQNTSYFFEDKCDNNCHVVEINNVCRSSIYQPTCNASVLCEGIAPNTCFGSELCYSDCSYYNVNSKQVYCNACGHTWTGTTCCGDASGEHYRNCTLQGGSCAGSACCNTSTSCVWGSTCYLNGVSVTPGASACGTTLTCNSGTWNQTFNQTACALCGEWTGNACCYTGNYYNFTGGSCLNGNVVLCSSDNECAPNYGIQCTESDPDCQGFSINITEESLSDDFKSVNFKTRIFSPKSTDLTIDYRLVKEGLSVSQGTVLRQGVNGLSTYNNSLIIPDEIEPGDYMILSETFYEGNVYSATSLINLKNNCIRVMVPSTIYVIVENQTIGGQTIINLFQNKSVDFKLDNVCNETISGLNAEFMGSSFSAEAVVFSTTFNSYPELSTMDNETAVLTINYEGGYAEKTITVVKISAEDALVIAETDLSKAQTMLQQVQLKAPFALLTLNQYTQDVSRSQELIELAEQSLNNSNYDDVILYSNNALTLLQAVDNTLTLPFLLAVSIIVTGVAVVLFTLTYLRNTSKAKDKTKKKK